MPIYKVSDKKNKEGKLQYRVRVNYIDNNGSYRQLTRLCWGSQEAKRRVKRDIQPMRRLLRKCAENPP